MFYLLPIFFIRKLIYLYYFKRCLSLNKSRGPMSLDMLVCLWTNVTNILKLCKTSSICPTNRLFGRNWRLNLDNFTAMTCYTNYL